jgi:hypothetical protein
MSQKEEKIPRNKKLHYFLYRWKENATAVKKGSHRSSTSCYKDKPKSEWAINKAQQNFAQLQIDTTNC